MAKEIERKFLINKTLWKKVKKGKPTAIKQGYLVNEKNIVVRIRISANKAFLTIKGKNSGASRSEFEYPVPKKDASEMLKEFTDFLIEKSRYELFFEGKKWEVDVFHGANDGLIIAEIELKKEKEKFSKPEWIEKEVTSEVKYYNSNLLKFPFKKWK